MSLRAKRRNQRNGINAKRKGPLAVCGGKMGEPFPTEIRVLKAKKPFQPPKPYVHDPRSIRERLLESNVDEVLEFEKARAKWQRWEGRKQKQRERAAQQVA